MSLSLNIKAFQVSVRTINTLNRRKQRWYLLGIIFESIHQRFAPQGSFRVTDLYKSS